MRVWITGAFAALIATLAGCYGNTTTMPDGTTSTADGWITEPPEGDWVNVSCDVVHPRQRNDCFRYHAGAKISAFETIQQARAREASAASGGSLGTYQHPSVGADDVLRWTNADCKNLQEPDRAACWRYELIDETNNEMAAFEAREQHIQQVGCPMATNGYRPMLDLAGQDASHVECDLAATLCRVGLATHRMTRTISGQVLPPIPSAQAFLAHQDATPLPLDPVATFGNYRDRPSVLLRGTSVFIPFTTRYVRFLNSFNPSLIRFIKRITNVSLMATAAQKLFNEIIS